jgi:phospholipid/cholesterol/gamma-HCH transport system ATP-binding protein
LIVVTHDIASARRLGDTLLMLHEGRIVASGSPDDLARSSDRLVRSFMSSQHSG